MKIKIFLCDLVHNYLGAGTYMFPLNIGYLAAYLNKFLKDKVEIKLFKYPDLLLNELEKTTPNIVGFSNYTWNSDINNKISNNIKSKHPEIMIVFGGPNINYTEKGIRDFFNSHKGADFFIPFQGEVPFLNFIKKAIEKNIDIKKIKQEVIDGIYSYDLENDKLLIGKTLPRIKNLDEIPSPYLTGVLDEFFDSNLIPIIETNRGCPYQCTFCCQGFSSSHQIHFFDIERVKKELDYISQHTKNTNILNLADSNFGIVERDMQIAEYISELSKKMDYPNVVSCNLAKNQPKIYELAKTLSTILVISLQSLDEVVLKKVKRSNIDISVFKKIIEKINNAGGVSGTEIILGLPGETKESHIKTIKELFDWDVSYIIGYNGLILDGSELAISKENKEFKCKTKYRLIDSSFGKYNGIYSFEAEEGIRSTDTMSEQEILFFRPIHWLIQFLWNYRFYYDLLKYLKILGINPLDYIISLINNKEKSQNLSKLFEEFDKEAKDEWFDSVKSLQDYYSKPENFKKLEKGDYGKMNGKYIFRVLLESKKDFEEHLYQTAINSPKFPKDYKDVFKELMNFLSTSIINIEDLFEDKIPKEKFMTSKYNLVEWQKLNYKKDLKSFFNPSGFKFRFYLKDYQEESLKTLLKQYSHKNKNVTLRKMSEEMSIKDFFYSVELVEDEEMGYEKTKTATHLKEIIVKDPYKILLNKFGEKYKIYRKEWKEAGERIYVPNFPLLLDVDITDSCNLACEYCLQHTNKEWKGVNMDKSTFIKILEESKKQGLYSINIGWNAEPILHKDLFLNFLDTLDNYDIIDIFLHTNAINLTEEIQKRILNSKITTICISLGAITDETRKKHIEKIKTNIINFKNLRDKLGKDTPIIRISIIPNKSNSKELKEQIEFWKEYADYVELQDIIFSEKDNKDGFEKQEFFCNDPWRRVSITAEGEIFSCCGFTYFTRDLKLGNIKDIPIKECWDSEKMKDLREQISSNKINRPGCIGCLNSVYKLKNSEI